MSNVLTEIDSAMEDAIELQEAGDFAGALRRARTAWMHMVRIPNSVLDQEELSWPRESIEAVVKYLTPLATQQDAAGTSGTAAAADRGSSAMIHSVPYSHTRG